MCIHHTTTVPRSRFSDLINTLYANYGGAVATRHLPNDCVEVEFTVDNRELPPKWNRLLQAVEATPAQPFELYNSRTLIAAE